MGKQFREGMKYSGEATDSAPGSCSSLNTNTITVLKREGQNITYQETFSKATGVAPVQNMEDWGEYITVGNDRFFAYAVEDE
ncbi:hypothetical protein NB640_00300 [Oxalobacter vibrioformis]|uniref:Uncharacterized protein n=1 Tax=Oxalobacter vibrioformis TaxID=933080 RepID=A0A9E9LXM6_9BURK|nr:hypothetical protein [Oxalobacter vibrioformis]WAW10151.1 hypothetical protein NB640_00300 [Oxalobacter vibrioformis]